MEAKESHVQFHVCVRSVDSCWVKWAFWHLQESGKFPCLWQGAQWTCQTTSEKGKTWQITAESSQRWIASLNVFEDSKASSESLHLIYLMDHDGRLSWGADEFAQMSSLGATCAVETPLEFKARLLVPVHPRFESRTHHQFLQLARLHQCEAKFHVVSTCSDPGILSHIREIQRTFIQKKAP